MCDLPDGVPFYQARYAMLGLRRLKGTDQSQNGTLRAEIVLGLLRLARAFDRLTRERGLRDDIAKSTFLRIAAQTAAAYPDSPRWSEHGVTEVKRLPDRPQHWVLEAVRPLAEAVRHNNGTFPQRRHQRNKSVDYDPNWPRRAADLATRLRSGDHGCLPDVKHLLDEERRYAETTGEGHPLVISLCRFASNALRLIPEVALRWAREAREWEPNNAFTWTTIKDVLVSQGEVEGALRFAWVAWKRFPENVVVCTGLADALKDAHRYHEAVEVYRQTVEKFPENVFARTGLANILKALHQYKDAEAVYRQTVEEFPDNVVARAGLADTLRSAGRLDEAEKEYRRIIELGYVNSFTFVALGYLVLRKGEAGRAEALKLADQALELDRLDRHALRLKEQLEPAGDLNLADLIEEWDQVADSLFQTQTFRPSQENNRTIDDEAKALLEMEEPERFTQQTLNAEAGGVAQSSEANDETNVESPEIDLQASIQQTTSAEAGEFAQPSEDELTDERVEEPLLKPEQPQNITQQISSGESSLEIEQLPASIQQTTSAEAEDLAQPSEDELTDERVEEPLLETEQSKAFSGRMKARKVEPFMQTHRIEPGYLAPYDSVKVSALAAEAYFYRTWAREAESAHIGARRHQKAAALVAEAEQLAPQDTQVLAEKLALAMDQGKDSVAHETLKVQLASHSAAAPLLVLKARLDRQRAREEKHQYDDSALTRLCVAPHRLRNLDPALAPLFHFQKGLAALALLDGTRRIQTATDAFTTFRQTLARRADDERAGMNRSYDQTIGQFSGFHDWLQGQVNNRVFVGPQETEQITVGAAEIHDLESNWEERRSVVEEVEDVFADRLTLSTL